MLGRQNANIQRTDKKLTVFFVFNFAGWQFIVFFGSFNNFILIKNISIP